MPALHLLVECVMLPSPRPSLDGSCSGFCQLVVSLHVVLQRPKWIETRGYGLFCVLHLTLLFELMAVPDFSTIVLEWNTLEVPITLYLKSDFWIFRPPVSHPLRFQCRRFDRLHSQNFWRHLGIPWGHLAIPNKTSKATTMENSNRKKQWKEKKSLVIKNEQFERPEMQQRLF